MAGGDLSLLAFTALVAAVGVERLVEQGVSRRHERWLAARGGRPVGDGHYPLMVALHALFLVACVAEPWLLARPFVPVLGWPMLALAVLAQALRWWAVRSLGRRWTTRIWVLPGAPRVAGGPYRFAAHPNYLAVAVELFALPLVHSGWLTAAVFGGADLVLLAHRIRVEEAALAAAEAAG